MRILRDPSCAIPGAEIRFDHEVTGGAAGRRLRDGDGQHACRTGGDRRRAMWSPPTGRAARCAARSASSSRASPIRAVFDRLDRLPLRGHADRHRLRQLHRRPGGMAGAAARARAVAGAGPGAGGCGPREAAVGRASAGRAAARRCARPSRITSRTARSITCTSAWRNLPRTAACCWPAMPRTSTIRSAAWA